MNPQTLLEIAFGITAGALAYVITRIGLGLRLGLFLLSDDSRIADQALIPITAENKRTSFWRSVFRGRWREDIELTLLDYQDHEFLFRVGFHLLQRFYLIPLKAAHAVTLDEEPAKLGQRYYVRTGTRLKIGSRPFKVLIAPTKQNIGRDFSFEDFKRID